MKFASLPVVLNQGTPLQRRSQYYSRGARSLIIRPLQQHGTLLKGKVISPIYLFKVLQIETKKKYLKEGW